ncbi:Gfo/Idh/MocA family oxidoreductase [Actinoplanes sp. Pm04-4]|uniref:Gfo/Idh/MocA family oxidoreductase n=1 Tax=Paractinoplanes pyxinae TaxID=2997416 RepID=A0ABT4BC35_9ACTN|nr:Gfo/Idh/MocA family oxidoreductase [Actinoplanes pyxinae]MCY1144081.1 Gfo/Idh/MocA family oxidoreductase [Actinoplanes pyxinae]
MRFGLFGTGPWAQRTQAPALQSHPDAEFTGVWGRRPEAAKEIAERFGTRAYDDVDALLADCDVVVVGLPPDIQAPLAVRAAQAGRHLLLDKPVATTVEGARAMTEAVDRAGVASVVFFTMHFSQVSADWLAARRAEGGWLLGRADWLLSVFADSDSPFAASPWRQEKGALWDVGPHALSMLLPILGDVSDVGAVRGPGDTVHLTLRHTSGAMSTCSLSHTVPPQASERSVQLNGHAGKVVSPDCSDIAMVPAYRRAIDELLAAAHTGERHASDVHFGRRVTEVLSMAESRLSE